MNMAERGIIHEFPRSESQSFEDLQLSLIIEATDNARANNPAYSYKDSIRQLVDEGKIVRADLERLAEEIDKKIKDHSYFDDLSGEQLEAVEAVRDYLDTAVFGTGSLGKELDRDADPGIEIIGRPAATRNNSDTELEIDEDLGLGVKDAA